ncbi:MAG: hypothetical protein M0Z31_07220 [Clostridia bacterium]|nr:hypothetical protein [Clostridia bacterium]
MFEKDKYVYAERFDKSYGDTPQRFLEFLNSTEIAVKGNYGETWSFIRADCNSLKRYTNFQLFFLNPQKTDTDKYLHEERESWGD